MRLERRLDLVGFHEWPISNEVLKFHFALEKRLTHRLHGPRFLKDHRSLLISLYHQASQHRPDESGTYRAIQIFKSLVLQRLRELPRRQGRLDQQMLLGLLKLSLLER